MRGCFVCAEVWTRGEVYGLSGQRTRQQYHRVRQGVSVGAGPGVLPLGAPSSR